ncbi:MAG: carbon storage regulator [Planctomycetota bacterium]
MLVLSRKEGEKLVIGDNVVITVNRISGNRVAIGIDAPREVSIVRGELDVRQREPSVDTRQSRRDFRQDGSRPKAASMLENDISVAGTPER